MGDTLRLIVSLFDQIYPAEVGVFKLGLTCGCVRLELKLEHWSHTERN